MYNSDIVTCDLLNTNETLIVQSQVFVERLLYVFMYVQCPTVSLDPRDRVPDPGRYVQYLESRGLEPRREGKHNLFDVKLLRARQPLSSELNQYILN